MSSEFGDKLRALRKRKGLSQQEVADSLKITRRAYIAYEKNNVRPRKRETYSKLAEIFSCDVDYLLVDGDVSDVDAIGILGQIGSALDSRAIASIAMATVGGVMSGGLALAALVFASMGTIAFAKSSKRLAASCDEKFENDLKKYETSQKRFRKMALACIMTKLTQSGMVYRQGVVEDLESCADKPDEYLVISEQMIDEWWFVFYSSAENEGLIDEKQLSEVLLSRFIMTKTTPNMAISFVVDDLKVYEELISHKESYSFKGNVSVILIDSENVEVGAEEIIANYDDKALFGIQLLK